MIMDARVVLVQLSGNYFSLKVALSPVRDVKCGIERTFVHEIYLPSYNLFGLSGQSKPIAEVPFATFLDAEEDKYPSSFVMKKSKRDGTDKV